MFGLGTAADILRTIASCFDMFSFGQRGSLGGLESMVWKNEYSSLIEASSLYTSGHILLGSGNIESIKVDSVIDLG